MKSIRQKWHLITRQHCFEAKVLTAFVVAFLMATGLGGLTWQLTNDANQATAWVEHTHGVLNDVALIRSDTIQIELSTQGFRVSGDPARLLERDTVIAAREILLNRLQRQVVNHPEQQARWRALRAVVDQRLQISRTVEQLRKTQGAQAATAFVATAPLQETRAQAHRLLHEMEVTERGLLGERMATQELARHRLWLAGVGLSVLLLLLFGATYVLIRRQFRALDQDRQALEASEERLSITIESIGDAVITTDNQGVITRMNPVAERLTGWSSAEAQGKPIDEVFCIINEFTRAPSEVPVAKVLATGIVHELANHTVLVARDGRECPIADSAAPIRDSLGAVQGVVIVFRDETIPRLAQQTTAQQNTLLEQRVRERTAQLQDSQAHLLHIINNVPALIAYVNAQQRYVYVNAQYLARFAPQATDITGWTVEAVLGPERYQIAGPLILKVLQGEPQSYDWQPFSGVWQIINYLPKRDEQGGIEGYYVLGVDVTERKRLESALLEAAVVFENAREGIMVAHAEGGIVKVNPGFTRITGYTASDVLGRSLHMLSSAQHNDTSMHQALQQGDFWSGETWLQRKSGDIFVAMQSVSVVRNALGQVQHQVSVFTDISAQKAHALELDRVANYDPLTLLPNRRLLSDRLKRSLVRTQRSGRLTAICGLDLDGFKHINDQHGHAIGDRFLMIMAQQLAAGLRAEDTLARLSGDEFVVLLSDLSTPKDCLLALDRMLDTVRLPLVVDGLSLHTTASIGVTLYPLDNADPDTLLRHADQAMYAAKQAGKDRYQLFDPDIDRKAQVERAFLDQLRQGLADETFVLFYQPKVDLVNGEVIGAEALIRWRHPQRGLLSPAEFLPQIIGTDLEHQFDEWVIHTALHQMQQWADEGLDIKVSINISAQHLLQADFHARLAQSLARFPRVVPAHVELEVLETAAIADMAQAVGILQQCMRLGVQFALDDFGTGYSSLTYLRKLPVHTLKIDQSFVRDMLVDPDDLSIVQGVIELAGAFHRQVIAEGVETQAHGVRLREMGCRFAQGYGIARPMPAQELPAWCRAWPRSPVWRA